ncbi:hypothetical protein N2152v2_000036 [Parachlorella kessleri]
MCNVSEAGGETVQWAFNVTLCSEAPPRKASALATFLTARKEFGATSLSSQVVDSSGRVVPPRRERVSKRKVQKLAAAALAGNSYFTATHTSSLLLFPIYWVEFTPSVIQFWDDNLADYNGNANYLAADLFAQVFQFERFGLVATTQSRQGESVGRRIPQGQGKGLTKLQLGRRLKAWTPL